MYLTDFFENANKVLVEQLSLNHKLPMNNCIYFCIKNNYINNHEFIDKAVENGASIIIHSDKIEYKHKVIYIKVSDVYKSFISIAKKFYSFKDIKTNSCLIFSSFGQTSICKYIKQLSSKETHTSIISDKFFDDSNSIFDIRLNSLTVLDLIKYYKHASDNDSKLILCESNLDLLLNNQYKFLDFNSIIISNIYHNKFNKLINKDYIETLNSFFKTINYFPTVLLNTDYTDFNEVISNIKGRIVKYGFSKENDYQIIPSKSFFIIKSNLYNKEYIIDINISDYINLNNLSSAIIFLIESGIDFEIISNNLKNLKLSNSTMYHVDAIKEFTCYIDKSYHYINIKNLIEKHINNTKTRNVVVMSFQNFINTQLNEIKKLLNNSKIDLLITTVSSSYKDNFDYDSLIKLNTGLTINNICIEDRKLAIEQALLSLNPNDNLYILSHGNDNFIQKKDSKLYYEGDLDNLISSYNKNFL